MKKILLSLVFGACALPLACFAAVELDGDSNGGTDIDKGGTNATTAAGALTNLGTEPVVRQADCSTITSGTCIDTDNGYIYIYDGDSVENIWPVNSASVSFTPYGDLAGSDIDTVVKELEDEKYSAGDTLQTNSGTTLPATCTVGQIYLDTDADTNGQLYACVATDTWKDVDDDGGAGGMSEIVEDTSPQLGGNLDIQTYTIEGVDATEFGYLDGVTSDIQTQLNAAADTIGWAYTALSSAPASPVTGKVYWADNDTWDPLTYAGTDDYAVMYTGSGYVGIIDVDGNLLIESLSEAIAISDGDGTGSLLWSFAFGAQRTITIPGDADATLVRTADVDDVPVDGATDAPVSSNRVYDHENASNPHSIAASTVGLGNVDNTSNVTERAATATLTNKTIDGDDNTLRDIGSSSLDLPPTILSSTQTLTDLHGNYIINGLYTITLSAVESGDWGCFQVYGAHAATLDPNASDLIILDGTALTDGTAIVSDGTTGNSICLQYYDSTGWISWGNNGWASE